MGFKRAYIVRILSILLCLMMIVVGSVMFLTRNNRHYISSDQQWGVGIFKYMNPAVEDTWYGYVLCYKDDAPDTIVFNGTIDGQPVSRQLEKSSYLELTWLEQCTVGHQYSALYLLVDLAPALPQVSDASLLLPDQTVIQFN